MTKLSVIARRKDDLGQIWTLRELKNGSQSAFCIMGPNGKHELHGVEAWEAHSKMIQMIFPKAFEIPTHQPASGKVSEIENDLNKLGLI